MAFDKRGISVMMVACLYLAVGVIGFIGHFPDLVDGHRDAVGIELTELAAAVAGVGLFLRQKWARWLAMAWILFHVGLSVGHSKTELGIHLGLLIIILWGLFRRKARGWFADAPA
jgi:hypothetical protein